MKIDDHSLINGKELSAILGRRGDFELWYDKNAFPFTVREFLAIEKNEKSGEIIFRLLTDMGAIISVGFSYIGEHELEIMELVSLAPEAHNIKVLVVDDEEAIVDVLEGILLSVGIEDISLAFNGETAIQAYKITRPHIVFSDFNMPDMNGLELLKKLRSLEFNGQFVQFSGYYAQVVEKSKQAEYKPDFIFPKPFRRSDVVNVLKVCFPGLVVEE